jgi:hypothetical protein
MILTERERDVGLWRRLEERSTCGAEDDDVTAPWPLLLLPAYGTEPRPPRVRLASLIPGKAAPPTNPSSSCPHHLKPGGQFSSSTELGRAAEDRDQWRPRSVLFFFTQPGFVGPPVSLLSADRSNSSGGSILCAGREGCGDPCLLPGARRLRSRQAPADRRLRGLLRLRRDPPVRPLPSPLH